MRTASLASLLRLAFGSLFAVIVAVGAIGVVSTMVTAANLERVIGEIAPAMRANDAALAALADAETGLRGYVYSGEDVALEPYLAARRRLPEVRAELLRSTAYQPALADQVQAELDAMDGWFDEYAEPRLELPVGIGTYFPARFLTGKRLFDEFRAAHSTVRSSLDGELAAAEAHGRDVQRVIVAMLATATLLALAVGARGSSHASRRIRRPVAELRDVLQRLASGDHTARARADDPAEVAQIARSVNQLADETDRLRDLERQEQALMQRAVQFARDSRSSASHEELTELAVRAVAESIRPREVLVELSAGPEAATPLAASRWSQPDEPGPDDSADVLRVDIRGQDGVAGQLVASAPLGRRWAPHEMMLCESVAADLGRALDQFRLFQQQGAAMARLRELDAAKNEFLSTVSHELRTPLTSISGYVELLEDDDVGPLTEGQRKVVEVVRRNADRLRALIEDLLTLSRIESGAFRSAVEPVEPKGVVESVVEDMQPVARRGGVEVMAVLPDDRVVVRGDGHQLTRAITNLVSNAIKFTPPGGRVRVEVRTEAEWASVVVEDTGIGIPDEEQASLFGRFFRATNAVSRGVPGTGLGLTIVRTIAENHGGSVSVNSGAEKGTTVTLSFPLWVDDTASPIHDGHAATSLRELTEANTRGAPVAGSR